MKPVAYHRLAASELIKSAELYERRKPSLGEAFLSVAEATLDDQARLFLKLIRVIKQQTHKLGVARDLLLPRLMSGEIAV